MARALSRPVQLALVFAFALLIIQQLSHLPPSLLFPSSRTKPSKPSSITETLVVACAPTANLSWLTTNPFPVASISPYRATKANEVSAYLQYIIERYDSLPDVSIFIHNHDRARHNNRLAGLDMSNMLARLDRRHVLESGYFNLRCDWEPGCPARLKLSEHPRPGQEDPEVTTMKQVWRQLLGPEMPLPEVLAQPCCAQFAASRGRIRSVSLAQWKRYQDWVVQTPLSDWVSGRVWEYTWQVVFAGVAVLCPEERDCYCDGYGLCFGGERGWRELERAERELKALRDEYIVIVSSGREDLVLKEKVLAAERLLEAMIDHAAERGWSKNDGRKRW